MWGSLVWAVEAELCGVTDRYTKDGLDKRRCGRALGAKYVKDVVTPQRAAGVWGELD